MTILPFYWWGLSPTPPTMYTQELSYLELTGALTAKLNEVIKAVNELEAKVNGGTNAAIASSEDSV